jgi:endonuclease/exonuclease/phosphatase family metal-dependent hydrolase
VCEDAVTELRLLQLNIEYGGTGVDFDAVIEVIRSSGAPIAALQEGCGNMPRVAAALEWPYYDVRTQVVSTLPLLDPPAMVGAASDGVVFVEVEPGRVIAVVNVHPPSRGFGPFRVQREPERRVKRRERRIRLAALQPSLDAARSLMDAGIPVVLLGDFNAPSHRDWTEDTVGMRSHMTAAFAWPTSVASEGVGLVDAYRAVYPDPVSHPGLTWPAQRPFVEGYNPAADGHAEDRIDLMYVSPDVTVDAMQIVGEAESEYSDVPVTPWPTDHRGLLAELRFTAAAPPTLVSVSRRIVPLGDDVDVWAVAGGEGDAADGPVASVVVVPHEADAGTVVFEVPLDGERGRLATEFIGAGRFDVVARDADRGEVARTGLWVMGPGDHPTVRTDRGRYHVGDPIGVRWAWTAGNRADWVAIYPRGSDVAKDRPLMNVVTGATVEGSGSFSEASHPRRWPLAAGEYTAHLLMDDLRVSLASTDFTVR